VDLVPLVEHDVVGLDVAVDDALLVGVRQGLGQFAGQPGRAARVRAAAFDRLRQLAAADEGGGDERPPASPAS
jgi:hypothetical protein